MYLKQFNIIFSMYINDFILHIYVKYRIYKVCYIYILRYAYIYILVFFIIQFKLFNILSQLLSKMCTYTYIYMYIPKMAATWTGCRFHALFFPYKTIEEHNTANCCLCLFCFFHIFHRACYNHIPVRNDSNVFFSIIQTTGGQKLLGWFTLSISSGKDWFGSSIFGGNPPVWSWCLWITVLFGYWA
jgi:hypothetical protein